MFDFGAAPPVAPRVGLYLQVHASEVAAKIAGNAADLAVHAVQYAHLVPLLGLVALVRGSSATRRVAALALAFAIVAAGAWATRDHARFLVIPLALLAAPAVLAGNRVVGRVSRRFSRSPPRVLGRARRARRLVALAVVALSATPLLAGHLGRARKALDQARAPEPDSVWSGLELDALAARLRALPPGDAFAATSPWGLALASGRDGLLLPTRLDGWQVRQFLARYPDVKAVVLRPGTSHDKLTPEPTAYDDALAAVASSESVGGATLLHLAR
jgi:hypothetical protein